MAKKIPDVLTIDEQERLVNQFNLRYIPPQKEIKRSFSYF